MVTHLVNASTLTRTKYILHLNSIGKQRILLPAFLAAVALGRVIGMEKICIRILLKWLRITVLILFMWTSVTEKCQYYICMYVYLYIYIDRYKYIPTYTYTHTEK